MSVAEFAAFNESRLSALPPLPRGGLTAVTLNAACAIGKGDSVGSIEPGKLADIVLWNADELPMLCYRMGSNQVKKVIKRGRVAVK